MLYATAKTLGKRFGLLRLSKVDRDEHPETQIMARKGRRFKTARVQPHPHFGHFPRKLSRSHANIYCVHARNSLVFLKLNYPTITRTLAD
jgi:hypothetical protein